MKLAFVYDSVHPWETGGVQTRVWEIARRLSSDHEVHWYGLHYWDGPKTIEREGVILHGVAPEQDLYVDGRRSIREAILFSTHLVRPLVDTEFDVIDCQSFPYFSIFTSELASQLHGTPLIVTWHEVWRDYWYEYLGRKGVLAKAIEWFSGRLGDEHVVVSERTRGDLEEIGVTSAKLVPNGVDMEEIDSVEPAEEHTDIVFAGRLIPEKNPELLVKAIDNLSSSWPDVHCRIIGDGPERDRVERLVAEKNLEDNVTLSGFLEDRVDLLALLKSSDVFALPSRREGFGITALESLACGTPVATIEHDQNAITGLLTQGETGVATVATPDAFADGIRRARSLKPTTCRRSVERYEWDQLAEEMENLYRSVMEGS